MGRGKFNGFRSIELIPFIFDFFKVQSFPLKSNPLERFLKKEN